MKEIFDNHHLKHKSKQVIITVAVPVGKRIYVNDNIGWGNDVRVDFGRNDDYWDWEDNTDGESYRFDRKVEYVMTDKGLERVSKTFDRRDEGDNEDSEEDNSIDQFRKSREQIEKERQNKLRELEEIDRELKKTTDSTIYRYKPDSSIRPATKTTLRAQVNVVQDSFHINDLLLTF